MFWLGYLYKKKSQNHNEILVKIYNDNSQGRTAREYKKDTARQIMTIHRRQARKVRMAQESRGQTKTDQQIKEEKMK
jgi:hypothetical protein